MGKMKNFFRKYLYLPIWYLLSGMPVPWNKFDEYEREMSKVVDAFLENGESYFRVNGILCRVYNVDGKMEIEVVQEDGHYTLSDEDFTRIVEGLMDEKEPSEAVKKARKDFENLKKK